MGDARGHASYRGQRPHAHFALQPPDISQIIKGVDVPNDRVVIWPQGTHCNAESLLVAGARERTDSRDREESTSGRRSRNISSMREP